MRPARSRSVRAEGSRREGSLGAVSPPAPGANVVVVVDAVVDVVVDHSHGDARLGGSEADREDQVRCLRWFEDLLLAVGHPVFVHDHVYVHVEGDDVTGLTSRPIAPSWLRPML